VLGLILPKTGTGVGLLLLPVKGATFVELEENTCTIATAVSGNVAGELEPVGKSQTTGKLTLAVTGGKQAITDFDLSTGGLVKPKLNAFSTEATQSAAASITFSKATEVT
jgi:hypothetical protein